MTDNKEFETWRKKKIKRIKDALSDPHAKFTLEIVLTIVDMNLEEAYLQGGIDVGKMELARKG